MHNDYSIRGCASSFQNEKTGNACPSNQQRPGYHQSHRTCTLRPPGEWAQHIRSADRKSLESLRRFFVVRLTLPSEACRFHESFCLSTRQTQEHRGNRSHSTGASKLKTDAHSPATGTEFVPLPMSNNETLARIDFNHLRAVDPRPSPLQLKNAVDLDRDAHRQRMHSQRASSRQIVLPKQRQQEVTGAVGHLRMLGERLFCTHVDC